jgi:twitching motility protein PilT
MMLAGVLEGVLCQRLLPRQRGGRVAAMEILIGTDAIRNMIREGKTHQIPAFLDAGAQYGMQTMDKALLELYRKGHISRDEALLNARKPEELKRQMANAGPAMPGGLGAPPLPRIQRPGIPI